MSLLYQENKVTRKVTIARIKQKNWKFDGNENFMLTIISSSKYLW